MPIGTGIIYNVGDLILGTVSGSGTAFLETKIAAATSSIVYFDSNARINSASLNSITVGTASYVSGSTSIITNLTASNISASGTSSFGYVGIGTSSPSTKLHVRLDNAGETTLALFENGLTDFASAAAGQIVVGARGYNHTVLRQNPDLGTTPSIGSSLDTVLANTCALGSGYGKLILATQSTASLIIDYSGNVGIGTASPTRKLDVNGDVNIGTNLVVVSGIYNANYYAGNSTATYFKNSVGTDTLTILQGGNVGIGTTSPLGKLHIVGGGNQGALVIQGSSIISHFYYGTNEDTYIRPGKTVGAVFIADVGGNVGIGTTTTTAKLHVSGSTGGVFEVDTAGGATSLYVSASGNIGIGTTTPNSTLQIAGTSTGILTVGTLTNDWGGVVAIGTTNGNGIILSKVNTANDSNRVLVLMRDDTNGASIIGYVPAGTSASVGFQIRASASSYFNGGNVGIGTTSPQFLLDVVSTSTTPKLRIGNAGSNNGAQLILAGSNTTKNWVIANQQNLNGTLEFTQTTATGSSTVDTTPSMVINSSGNVGIGTTSPAAKLYVVSSGGPIARFDGSSVASSGATEIDVLGPQSNGDLNLGIGGSTFNEASNNIQNKAFITAGTGLTGLNLRSDAGYVQITTGGIASANERMRIAADGNVGIGTTGALTNGKLQISGSIGLSGNTEIRQATNSDGNTLRLLATQVVVGPQNSTSYGYTGGGLLASVSSAASTITLDVGGNVAGHRLQIVNDGTGQSGYLNYSNAGTSSFFVNSVSGNVGIGTTSPSAKLNISLDGVVANTLSLINVGSWGNNTVQLFNSNGGTTGNEVLLLGCQAGGNGQLASGFGFGRESSATWGTYISLKTHSPSTSVIDELYERVRITADGYVGIGTSSPKQKLHIVGEISLRESDGYYWNAYYSSGFKYIGTGYAGYTIVDSTGAYTINTTNSSGTADAVASMVTRLYISSSGNVGIGQSAPAYKLDVNGTSRFANDLLSTGNITITKAGAYLYLNSTNSDAEIIWMTSGSPRWAMGMNVGDATENFNIYNYNTTTINLHINKTSGNVGIGTTSPGAKLQVDVSSASGIRVNGTGGYANILSQGGHLEFYKDSTPTYAAAIGLSTPATALSNDIQFATYNGSSWSARMTIANGGNIGIGTTSPGTSLEVYAVPATTSSLRQMLIINTDFASASKTGFGGSIVFKGRTAGNELQDNAQISAYNEDIGDNGYALGFYTRPTVAAGLLQRMTILRAGNVGIGTTSPVAKLDVNGTSNFAANTYHSIGGQKFFAGSGGTYAYIYTGTTALNFINGNDTSTLMTLLNGGNVGIGTTSPTTKLYVSGSVTALDGRFISNVTSGTDKYFLDCYGTSTNQIFALYENSNTAYLNSYSSMAFRANQNGGSGGYFIFSGANVGIGTSSPTGQLHLYSSTSAIMKFDRSGTSTFGFEIGGTTFGLYDYTNSEYRWRAFSRNLIINESYGDVGIGTTSPAQKLSVTDTLSITNSAGTQYLLMGNQDSAGVNNPAIIQASNGNLSFGGGTSWSGSGGTFTSTVFLSDAGNVGIGTTSPVTQLHVSGSLQIGNGTNYGNKFTLYDDFSSGKLAYVMRDLNSDDIFGLYCNSTTGEVRFLADDDDANTAFMTFQTNASERMRITNAGSVGIGVTPTTIVGASGVNGKGLQGDSWTISSLQGTDESYFGNNLYSSAYNVWSNRVNAASGAYYLTGGTHIFLRGAAQPSGSITPTESMRITDTGAVGIGLTNPNTKLQVSGSATIGGYNAVYSGTGVNSLSITAPLYPVLAFYYGTTLAGTVGGYSDHVSIYAPASKYISFEPGDSEKMRITADGNVGIGTTSPTAKLQINNASDSRLIVYETGTSPYTATLELSSQVLGTYGATVQYTSDTEKLTIQNYGRSSASSTQGGILFRTKLNNTTATDVMAINGFSGNVGIGTTVPVAKLEISGSSNSALLNIKSPISGAILFVSGSGAVGINTSTVGAYTLQVNGSFAATTKSFIIDHPTKAGKKLIYGSLESPYHGIRLTGRDTLKEGKCKVELPDYIYKLILHDSVNIQLTGIKCNKTLYVDEINIPENYFTIAYDNAIFESYKDYDFFWDFTGIRTDVPELITEL